MTSSTSTVASYWLVLGPLAGAVIGAAVPLVLDLLRARRESRTRIRVRKEDAYIAALQSMDEHVYSLLSYYGEFERAFRLRAEELDAKVPEQAAQLARFRDEMKLEFIVKANEVGRKLSGSYAAARLFGDDTLRKKMAEFDAVRAKKLSPTLDSEVATERAVSELNSIHDELLQLMTRNFDSERQEDNG